MSALPSILLQKSPRRSCRIKIRNNRIGANGFLNQRCALTPDLESILRTQTGKILLQQNRYYTSMSQIQLVYGSLTTSIAVLLSVEIGALVFLLGAQVIAEYERIGHEPIVTVPQPMRTEAPRQ